MSHPLEGEPELEFKWGKRRGTGKNKDVQFYESFTYDGVDYTLHDTVYMFKEGEPEPYIGKLVKIYEVASKSIKKVVEVQWFFRPSEIADYLKDVEVLENELFLASGSGRCLGLTNINPLEAIAGKCNVICISMDNRNPQPSVEERQKADYVFYRTFDVKSCKISDQMGDIVGLLDVKFVFNRSVKGGERSVIPHKRTSKLEDKNSSHELNNENLGENGHSVLNKSVSIQQVQAKEKLSLGDGDNTNSIKGAETAEKDSIMLESQISGCKVGGEKDKANGAHFHANRGVQVGEKVNSANKFGNLDDIPSKRARFDGTVPSLLVEDPNGLQSLGGKPSKTDASPSREKSESAHLTDFVGIEKDKELGGNYSASIDRVPSNDVSLSPNETPKSRSNKDVEVFGQGEKFASKTKGLFRTSVDPPKENLKLERKAVFLGKDSTLVKNSSPMVGGPQNKAKDNEAVMMGSKSKETTCANASKNSPFMTPLNSSERTTKKCHDKEVEEFSRDKWAISTFEGCDGKVEGQIFEVTRKQTVEKSNWMKLPWEQKMKDANDNGKLVLLQNLDPEFTSTEVEDIIWHAFKESCTAKMVQHTAISNPHSGQAYIVFKSRETADKVVKILNDRCLMLPNQRPLVACHGFSPKFGKQEAFVGHLTIDRSRHNIRREMKEALSTSHCPQTNTIEFEMAMAWCLLQAQADKWWEMLYQRQKEEMEKLVNALMSK